MRNFKFLVLAALILTLVFVFAYYLNSKQSLPQEKVETKSNPSVTITGYEGKVLAGNTSVFLDFTKTDYDKALAEGKIVFLDFYANWCPICRAEEPAIKAGFDNLTTLNVVGFRVNYKDTDTDMYEDQLAKDFNVPYQHHKIILKDGKVVLSDGDTWDKDKVVAELNSY